MLGELGQHLSNEFTAVAQAFSSGPEPEVAIADPAIVDRAAVASMSLEGMSGAQLNQQSYDVSAGMNMTGMENGMLQGPNWTYTNRAMEQQADLQQRPGFTT